MKKDIYKVGANVSLTVDEAGLLLCTGLTAPSLIGVLMGTGMLFLKQLFSRKDSEEQGLIQYYLQLLDRLKARVEIDPTTGTPVVTADIEKTKDDDDPGPQLYIGGKKKKHRHKLATRKRKKRLVRKKYIKPIAPAAISEEGESEKEKKGDPIVVKHNSSTIIYNIQNITINVTAEVVNQLNMSPQQVVNHFHNQITQAIDLAVKKELPSIIEQK